MKAMDIIDRVDLMEPNQYSPEQKLHWLSNLDGKLFNELVRPRDPERQAPLPYESGQEQLLIPQPYGEDIYYNYLQAMIAAENSETQRYNRRMTMFNSLLMEYANFLNRSQAPVSREGTHFIF